MTGAARRPGRASAADGSGSASSACTNASALYDGTITAGPTGDGGWQLTCRLARRAPWSTGRFDA